MAITLDSGTAEWLRRSQPRKGLSAYVERAIIERRIREEAPPPMSPEEETEHEALVNEFLDS